MQLIRLFHQGKSQKHDYLLYDLENNIGESSNLTTDYLEVVIRLGALIEQHIKETGAVVPVPNLDFDLAKYRPGLIGVPHQRKVMELNRGK